MTTMTDRCDCPYPDPMTYGGPNPLCPEHGDVDAILASEEYRDRKGRTWFKCVTPCAHGGGWWLASKGLTRRLEDWHLTPAQMRTLIERDLHRDECPGLRDCDDHPVPHVVIWLEGPTAHDTHTDTEAQRDTLAGAITAARRMTGETP